MPLIFLLLLPLVLVPYLVESNSRWFRRFAWLIAGIQAIWVAGYLEPNGLARMLAGTPDIQVGLQFLIKAVIHIY